MVVVNARDFRSNQGKFLDMARNGEQVVLRTRHRGDFMLNPVTSDVSEDVTQELLDELETLRQEVRNGDCVVCKTRQDLIDYLESL